jgi:hypothetical protein
MGQGTRASRGAEATSRGCARGHRAGAGHRDGRGRAVEGRRQGPRRGCAGAGKGLVGRGKPCRAREAASGEGLAGQGSLARWGCARGCRWPSGGRWAGSRVGQGMPRAGRHARQGVPRAGRGREETEEGEELTTGLTDNINRSPVIQTRARRERERVVSLFLDHGCAGKGSGGGGHARGQFGLAGQLGRHAEAAPWGRGRERARVSHLDLGGQTQARFTCVLGSSLTHMMTHGTTMNVTSLIYN